MAEVIVRFTTPITGQGGEAYQAQASGAIDADGLWEGWIEFIAPTGAAFRTPRETQEPNRTAMLYWAEGLTTTYLEGALRRALDGASRPGVGSRVTEVSVFDRPAATRPLRPTTITHAVLDPIAVRAQGEHILRSQLLALSRDHLLAIVEAYDLRIDRLTSMSHGDLVDAIVTASRSSVG